MKNIKQTTLDNLDQSLLIRNDKSNVAESVKPMKVKPMSSLNGVKSFQPKRTVTKFKKD